MPELQLCLRSSPALAGCITHPAPKGGYSSFLSIEPLSLIPLVQPSSRTCKIDATKIANSIIEEIRKRATIWHQISGGVERAAVRSGKTIKKRRLFVKVSTERPLGSGKRITITVKLSKELAVSRVIHRCFYRAVRAKHTQSFTQDRALYAKALGLTAKDPLGQGTDPKGAIPIPGCLPPLTNKNGLAKELPRIKWTECYPCPPTLAQTFAYSLSQSLA
ncbi:hypothetical protein FH972_025300 [Carpinus fangiana]|uniref:Uncharacterized protein n=1 Tax=Carpinus fangiana TaxID=176857 RepID=A0A5N6L0V8_9ROSI|nr:hypothetical protein FH972_025300 [Carpinus fangiana]